MTNLDGMSIDGDSGPWLAGPDDRHAARGAERGSDRPSFARPLAVAAQVAADALAFGAAYGAAVWIAGRLGADAAMLARALPLVGGFAILQFWTAGLYPGKRLQDFELLRRRTLATTQAGGLAALLAGFALGDWALAACVAVAALVALALQGLLQPGLRHLLHRAGWWAEPALILADPEHAQPVTQHLERNWQYGLAPVSAAAGRRVRPRVAVVATAAPLPPADLAELRRRFDEVLTIADTPDFSVAGWHPADLDGRIGLSRRSDRAPGGVEALLRRLGDLAIAGLALFAFWPIMLAAAAAIWTVDPGPIFYRQAREGLGGRKLNVLKLRTMYRDADLRLERLLAEDPAARREWETHFKLKADPRILPGVGGFLRSYSCDELPQIFNVLAGEMSVVGPRPLPDYHLAAMASEFRAKRSSVLPGMTGLWQVSKRSDADIVALQQLDDFYIENRSLWFDWHIIAKTFRVVFTRAGAY